VALPAGAPFFPGDFMATWVIADCVYGMPPGLAAAYGALPAEYAAALLTQTAAGTIADFRRAFSASADPVGCTSGTLVPDFTLSYVQATVWYLFAAKVGYDQAGLRPGWTSADLYLRQALRDLVSGTSVLSSSSAGTPRYAAGPYSGARATVFGGTGVAAAAPSDTGTAPVINYVNLSPPLFV